MLVRCLTCCFQGRQVKRPDLRESISWPDYCTAISRVNVDSSGSIADLPRDCEGAVRVDVSLQRGPGQLPGAITVIKS